MNIVRVSLMALAAGTFGLAGCNDGAPSLALFNDSTVTADVANTAGEAMATAVETMAGNEDTVMPVSGVQAVPAAVSISRSRTCLDQAGAEVPDCNPHSSVRTIVTHVTLDGDKKLTISNDGGKSVAWTDSIHRVADDTVTRNFNGDTEQSRTHDAVAVAHDTSSFTGEAIIRHVAEAAHDTVKSVTWNVPRSSNPFPVSGSIIRVDSVHVTFTKGGTTETRDVVRTAQVTFPADAQGNVTLTVNNKTCNLNLVTHRVGGCH